MRRRVLLAASMAALLATSAGAKDNTGAGVTLVDNVNGVTLDAAGQPEALTGLLFDQTGVIRRVLHAGDHVAPDAYAFHVDGGGAVLLPGLIDAHLHVMALGFAGLTLDLSDTQSLAEAQAKIRAFAAANPGRPWILGRGWNQELWHLTDAAGHSRFPTAAELDAAVSDRPVWLGRVDGHAGWANHTALTAAGVTGATPVPAGGQIPHLADGSPAGVLVDAASALVQHAVPPPRAEDRDAAFALAQTVLVHYGLTAAADMGTSLADWQTWRRAGDANRLYLRIMAYGYGVDSAEAIAGTGPTPWLYQDRLRLNGVKLYMDGALGSRGAWLKAPYSDAPGTGTPLMSEAALGNAMSRAAAHHFQVAVHAIGDRANATVLGMIEALAPIYNGDRRWRIEHAQIVDPADIPRFGHFGVVASMQPVHETSDRTMAEARLGPNRLAGAYAWQSLRDAGAVLAFGSDAPVERPDPWAGIAAAITRQGPDGEPAGGWQAQERVSRVVALAGYTTEAARAGFAEDRLGRLAPGYRADFILVDTNPLTAPPEAIRKTRVLQTWVGGGKVFDAAAK